MNTHEQAAWRTLIELGARSLELGGKPALDLSAVRISNARNAAAFVDAVVQVAGRSGMVRRHQNRRGQLVFVVTDERVYEGATVTPAELREWREARGWSQTELGIRLARALYRRVPIAQSTVSQWEAGEREPDVDLRAVLAAIDLQETVG